MSRREAWLSALAVFVVAVAVRAWVASLLPFPRPEDTAYYVDVARNLVGGHGLVSNAIWSYQTPPLVFPRPAFEVWLPLPTFLAAIPMALFGATFASAQVASILVCSIVAVLAWRLAADIAIERGLPVGRARALALGVGFTAAVYLPLVLASAEPDSTMPFAAITLGACLVMARLGRARVAQPSPAVLGDLLILGVLLGLAALTRNEAVWLALVWAVLAWGIARRSAGAWLRLVAIPAAVALVVFAPWAIRDWQAFGTPLPGQALANALSLKGTDIFAWANPPTLANYLGAGFGTLAGLRVTGLVHNVWTILLLLGTPISAIGLIALPWTARSQALRPLLLFAVATLVLTTLLFPVSSTWGTFQHAAGPIEVLLLISAVLALDWLIDRVGRMRGWTRPVAWLGPLLTITAGLLFTVAILPSEGDTSRTTAARFTALPAALAAAGAPLPATGNPVITDSPIWFAAQTGHEALALPDEPPASVLDLAHHFGATLLIIQADAGGTWPAAAGSTLPDGDCFTKIALESPADAPHALDGTLAFRIGCP